MAYVPQFECDVFVSYATANDQPYSNDKETGWVTAFRDDLRRFLDAALGRRKASEVWMDYKLRGNEPFDVQLRDKVTKSAVLLIVLSDAYLKSPWCQKELEVFVEAASKTAGGSGRIFLVHYEPVPPQTWPTGLKGHSDVKFRFFQQERDGATPEPLGFPLPNPENSEHKSYYTRLLGMSKELADQLKAMVPPAPPPPGPVAPVAPVPPVANKPAVFLAEVTGDKLFDDRDLVKSHLEQLGWRVLPAKPYSRTPAAFAAEMDRDLEECLMFVQMLGRFGSPRTPDLAGGYEGLQHERATAKKKEILRWRSRDLPLTNVPDPDHRALLEGVDVKAMDLDELKRKIEERMRILSIPPPPPTIAGQHFIGVKVTDEDVTLADAITAELARWNVGYDIPDPKISLSDLAESNTFDAFMVIYGQCSHDWVRQELMVYTRLKLTLKRGAPACAVYVGPPENKAPLRCRPPGVAIIDPHQLQAFIEKLPAREGSV